MSGGRWGCRGGGRVAGETDVILNQISSSSRPCFPQQNQTEQLCHVGLPHSLTEKDGGCGLGSPGRGWVGGGHEE